MSSGANSPDDFLADPESQSWIVHCVMCGRQGRNPESPVSQLPPRFRELFPSLMVTPDGVCQVCLPAHNEQKKSAAILKVLNDYVAEHVCPCNWEQFEFWMSKDDEYQRILAEAAVNLPCFKKSETVVRGDSAGVVCKHCGKRWHYSSGEWRMMMYWYRFVPEDKRTTSFDLKPLVRPSFNQWYEFMLGRPYDGPPVTYQAKLYY